MSDETLLIQRSRHIKKKFASDELSTSTGDHDRNKYWKHIPIDRRHKLDGPESSDNTISGPSQFELVACNLGKPSDLTPLSIVDKRLPAMPTIPVLAQPILFVKLFRVIKLDGFNPSPLCTRVENFMTHINKYQELHKNFSKKLTETALSTRLAAIQRHVEKTSLASEQKLKHLESIQAKRLRLEDRKVELVKELEQFEVEMQEPDAEIHKVNDEMSRDHHLMAHLAIEQAKLTNTPIVSYKDSEDLKAFHISLEEERAEVAQLM
ncbi:hypothetical protein ACH5RR_012807 [Cinchona calisaya]|uniref:Uncharacterized protein n=1 Tax=Cinchona calisaya TaxID=153742 RepID=A0ABD3A8M4_9GENT